MPEHRKCFPYGAGIRGSGTWRRGWGRLELLPGAVRNCMRLRDPACGLPFDRGMQSATEGDHVSFVEERPHPFLSHGPLEFGVGIFAGCKEFVPNNGRTRAID